MKSIAYFKRFCHLIYWTYKLETNHLAYTQGKAYYFLGIKVWFSANKIYCTCGKKYYDKEI
jgi:hypothetical protein